MPQPAAASNLEGLVTLSFPWVVVPHRSSPCGVCLCLRICVRACVRARVYVCVCMAACVAAHVPQHLTGPCFRDFKKHVKAHPGWNAQQRRASVEDKAKYRPTGRGHASWIDVVYTPPATSSQSASSGSAINKKAKKAASSKGSKK